MTLVGPKLEWRRHLRSPLVIALLLSLLLHVYVWLMALLISAALQNGWLPAWLQPIVKPVAALVEKPKPAPVSPPVESWQEIPLQFIEVDPTAATEQTPPDTKYYSTANTLAANPDPPKVEQAVPKIDGRRENSLKTFDTTQPSPQPPPPAPQESAKTTEPPAPPQEERPPQPAQVAQVPQEVVEATSPPVGETLLAKVNPQAIQPEAREPQEARPAQEAQTPQEVVKPRRPKTVAQAMASKGVLVGERMKQDGGVNRPAIQSSLNVKASPLGDYNYRMVIAVQTEWYRTLQDRNFALDRQGQVVVTFNLHSDGTVTSVNAKDSNVGDVLTRWCEFAIMRPAPFDKWPPEVRRLIGGDTIPITFTFNYY